MNEQLIDIAELSPFSYQVAAFDWILLCSLYAISAALYLSARRPGWWRSYWQGRRRNVYSLAATRLTALTKQAQLNAEHLHRAAAVTRHALFLSIGDLVKASSASELQHLIREGMIDAAYNDLCATLGELDTLRFASSPDLTRGGHLLSRLEEEMRKLQHQRATLTERKR